MEVTFNKRRVHGRSGVGLVASIVIMWLGVVGSSVAAWFTAVITSINHVEKMWVWLVVDILIPPIGVVHGWGIWFGFWY